MDASRPNKLIITIDLSHSAFENDANIETAEVLRSITRRVEGGDFNSSRILTHCGDEVGHIKVV
jgi:hypothetical protein